MADVVVSLVLETFRDLLVEEATFLCGVGGEVTQLQKELERMQSFLKDADSKQHDNEQLQTWVRQIRDLAYRAEDVLETYSIKVMSKRELSSGESKIKKLLRRFACFLDEGMSMHNVGTEIGDIKNDLANLRESLTSSGVNPISKDEKAKEKEEKQRLLRQTFPREDKNFVGMVDEIKELVSLVKDVNDHKVISIWGMGGSGKTTMAKKIYNHPQVKPDFEGFAWVCIAQNCDLIATLKDILKQLTNNEAYGTSSELRRNLMVLLQEKKCLVVLDDIWKVDDWEFFSHIIPDEEGQSKILLTTRIEEVARVGFLHKQRLLKEEEGLELLRKKALPQHKPNDPQIEQYFAEFGREMINKCGKLPLAISILGGILRNRPSLKEWKRIHNDIDSTLNQDLGNLEDSGTISKVLSLSYYDLPHFLKPCFLYMSVFREDQNIDPKKLYHLWIAEGLISKRYCLKGETLMDVADRFLKALISRSMVQVEADPILEDFWWFRVHDMMRDLCLRRARDECFLETLTDEAGSSVIGVVPRFSVHMSVDDANEERCIDPFDPITNAYVRAIFFEIAGHNIWLINEHTVVKVSMENFQVLRILDFNFCMFHEKKLPRGMDRLIHLRYLSLFACNVKELPSYVGDLPLLQTLDLRTGDVIQIPHDIFSKKSPLIHLYIDLFTCGPEKKLHLSGLGQLETFILRMEHQNSPIELMELSELTSIRHFQMVYRGDENDDQGALIMDQMKSWKRIKTLELKMIKVKGKLLAEAALMSPHVTQLNFEFVDLATLPKYEPQFGQNLEKLAMKYCDGVDGTILFEWLGKMQNIKKLNYNRSAELRVMPFDQDNFLQLKSLEIHGMYEMEELVFGEGSLPNLIELELDHCNELKIVPVDGLKYLRNLRELRLGEAMSSLKDICQMHQSQYPHVKIVEKKFDANAMMINILKIPFSMMRTW